MKISSVKPTPKTFAGQDGRTLFHQYSATFHELADSQHTRGARFLEFTVMLGREPSAADPSIAFCDDKCWNAQRYTGRLQGITLSPSAASLPHLKARSLTKKCPAAYKGMGIVGFQG